MTSKLLNFIEVQEALDNLSFTLSKLYHGDEMFTPDDNLQVLTEKTYEVMEYMRTVHEGLTKDAGVIQTAERLNLSVNEVASDIADIMLMSTVARQSILLEKLS